MDEQMRGWARRLGLRVEENPVKELENPASVRGILAMGDSEREERTKSCFCCQHPGTNACPYRAKKKPVDCRAYHFKEGMTEDDVAKLWDLLKKLN